MQLLRLPDSDTVSFGGLVFALSSGLPIVWKRICKSVEELSARTNNPEIRKKRGLIHDKFSPSKIPENIDYIVIGSGMSGLSCAAILARLGRRVLVLEQHDDVAGGGTHMFDVKGFEFDSGLHYTVPWSVPIFALTCLKRPSDCIPFDLMVEDDGTIDKIYMNRPGDVANEPFRMKYKETHLQELYQMFPHEKQGLDKYLEVAENSMHFVKVYLFARLLPRWLQPYFWSLIPSKITNSANFTAKEILPKLISDKRLISLLSSMWIDTGARPDRASFMLTASVFRGISMEGGAYPKGGSKEMAKELVTVIESFGGRVLVRCPVAQVTYDRDTRAVTGVKLSNGQLVTATRGVVSSVGYSNTFEKLVSPDVSREYNIPTQLSVPPSSGFVMVNLGIDCGPDVLGASRANTWHIPVDSKWDAFPPLERYFQDPLAPEGDMPAFITFPSLKDTSKKSHETVSCQMLLMADYEWFQAFKAHERSATTTSSRLEGYERLKSLWRDRAIDIFLRYFPKARGHIKVADVSTPLTIEDYLGSPRGGAVGLDVTPERFCNAQIRDALDPVTRVPKLYLTGQDTAICGVTLCQLTGVITAFRMEGLWAAVKILAQSIILGDNK